MAPGKKFERVGRIRWFICALLFAAILLNYIDRQMIGLLKPQLQKEFGWSETAYGDMVFYFQAAFAASYVLFGRFVDRFGAKVGYATAFIIWTAGHIGHAFARTVVEFALARSVLGVGEGGSFPSGITAISDWFPKSERAMATGLSSTGASVGAIVAPLIVPFISIDLAMGWRATFVITGVGSSLWLLAWLSFYRAPRAHKGLSVAELDIIERDRQPDTKASWSKVALTRETWGYALGRFLIDPVWWLMLFWLPDFFSRNFHLDMRGFALPLVLIYVSSDIGSIAGGWLSGALLRAGLNLNRARKLALLICACMVLPIAFVTHIHSLWLAVGAFSLATAGHLGFSANLFVLPSDLFPRSAVGSVLGIGGTAGAIGGMALAKSVGLILQTVGDYTLIFIVASMAYLAALAAVQIASPRYEPVSL